MTHSMKSRWTHTNEHNRTNSACSTQTTDYAMHIQHASIILFPSLALSGFIGLLGLILLPRTIIL